MKYKFSELNKNAQWRAMQDYQKGWNKTHPDEKFTFGELFELCMNTNDDVFYNKEGEVIEWE